MTFRNVVCVGLAFTLLMSEQVRATDVPQPSVDMLYELRGGQPGGSISFQTLRNSYLSASTTYFDPRNYGAVCDDLGKRWEVMTIAPRAYPCGHYIQPFLDAALSIVRQSQPDPAAIERVECRVADYMVPLICEPALEKISPTTSWHGRYSLAFCVAECLLNGRFDKYSLAPERLADPRYTALTRRTGYSVDPTATDRTQWSGEVVVTMHDGTILRHRIEHMHGTPQNPITQDELIAKFLHNAQGVLEDNAAHAAIDRILDLDRASDIREIFAPLSGLRR